MALLQIVLLLLYALPFMLCLPITLTPLEDHPDNLALDTQLFYENRYASDRESVRKIPKSIFITPNHPDAHGCRSGYVMGDDKKCYKSQNFNLDPLDILKTQVESFLVHDKMPTTVDYDEDYDYDSYDSTTSPSDTTTDQSSLVLNDEIIIDSSMSTKKDHVEKDESLSTLDDQKEDKELQSESLFQDNGSMGTSTSITDESFKLKFGLNDPKKPDKQMNEMIYKIRRNMKDMDRKAKKCKKAKKSCKDNQSLKITSKKKTKLEHAEQEEVGPNELGAEQDTQVRKNVNKKATKKSAKVAQAAYIVKNGTKGDYEADVNKKIRKDAKKAAKLEQAKHTDLAKRNVIKKKLGGERVDEIEVVAEVKRGNENSEPFKKAFKSFKLHQTKQTDEKRKAGMTLKLLNVMHMSRELKTLKRLNKETEKR